MFFFFSSRRRHTRFDCDWSSDVCSSDLRRSRPLATWTSRWSRPSHPATWSGASSRRGGGIGRGHALTPVHGENRMAPSACEKNPTRTEVHDPSEPYQIHEKVVTHST